MDNWKLKKKLKLVKISEVYKSILEVSNKIK